MTSDSSRKRSEKHLHPDPDDSSSAPATQAQVLFSNARKAKKPRTRLGEGEYADSKKRFMALINEIRSTGAALEVDLPTIVVAGNQSSGKSSLIEAISEVSLPRATGTCTRVPIEVRLKQEAGRPWQAGVKIRWEVNEDGNDREDGHRPEVVFGPMLSDPSLVEATIRRAQLAILNPSVSFEKFVKYELPAEEILCPLGSTKQLAFSRNVIVLEISGPKVADLTLVDLPGIIQNVGKDGDRRDIGLVEELVKDYIKKDCLILLVITMKDDIQNQKAVALAQDVDPDGKRTIGVLTKVDTLHGSETDMWVKVLRNEKEPLLHGYYVMRQPNADELAEEISFEDARAKETDFFDETAPWCDLSPALKRRLGTINLTSSLSDQLLSFIRDKLPRLVETINQKYQQIQADLLELGDAPSDNYQHEMMTLIGDFTSVIEAATEGRSGHEQLMQDIAVEYEKFKANIWATAPRFAPFTKAQLEQRVQEESKSFDCVDDIEELGEGQMGPSGTSGEAADLDDVRQHVKKAITRELPNNIPFPAKVTLMKRYMSDWEDHASNLVDGVVPLLEALLEHNINEIFGRYTSGMLPGAVNECVSTVLADLKASLNEIISKVIAQEHRPFTMNDHSLSLVEAKIFASLTAKRYGPDASGSTQAIPSVYGGGSVDLNQGEKIKAAIAQLAVAGYTGITADDLAKLRPTDGYETELGVMAETRAYWQVAFKRIIDTLPRWIDSELIIPLSKAIKTALLLELDVFSEDGQQRCKAFLAESPVVTRQREDLEQRRKRLEVAKRAIKKFGVA